MTCTLGGKVCRRPVNRWGSRIHKLAGLMLCLGGMLLAQAVNATTGPILSLPLDETAGTTAVDISGQSNNGTLYNGPVWTTGVIGGGLRFDGTNDYLSRSSVQGLPSGNTPHTVAGWIKVNALPSNRAWISLLGSAGTGSHCWLLYSGGGTQFGAWAGAVVSPSLPVGVWKHVAITFDGTTLTGYVDGVAFDSKPATFNLQGGNPLSIGKMILSGENYFNGVVDDMRIYDRALDAAEVAALAANQPPVVSISAPAAGSSFDYPANITLTANATDSGGSIAKVEYYNGATLIGSATTAPYGVSWSPDLIGSYTLKARAIDNLGTSTMSSAVSVNIVKSPTGPVLTWPLNEGSQIVARDTSGYANDGTLYNGPVWVAGRNGGKSVKFDGSNDYLSRSTIQGLATGNTPHTIAAWLKVNGLPSYRTWIVLLGNAAGGSHHWLLNSAGSTQFGVYGGAQVSPVLPVGEWRHVAVTFDGATMTGYVNGAVIDSKPASFNIQGMPLTVAKPPNSESYFNGVVDDVRIYDRALSAEEVQAIVTAGNVMPTVSLTSPTNGSTFFEPASVTLSADAADSDDGIAKVDFYSGETLIGTVTAAPYVGTWSDVGVGSYQITTKATDKVGGSVVSSVSQITVAPYNNPPTVQITVPTDNSSFKPPVSLLLQASASDVDGVIAKVDYYDNGTLVGTATVAPYAVTLENVAAGAHVLTAIATDNAGATTTSAAVNVSVDANGGGASLYYIQPDHLNTPRLITDLANQVVWRWDSDPFGTTLANEDPDGNGVAFTYNLRFPGQFYDKETGLHYNYFRDYDPSTGRYVQSDPIGLAGGLNVYGYVNSNSLSYSDPEGLRDPSMMKKRQPTNSNRGFPNGNTQSGYTDQDWICTSPAGFLNEFGCTKQCCIEHDKCYEKYQCNMSSWGGELSSDCQQCNLEVVRCVLTANPRQECLPGCSTTFIGVP